MNKVLRIIRNEYIRHVFRKRFIFALISIPIMMLILVSVSLAATILTINKSPLGYVDHSGVLKNQVPAPATHDIFSPQVKIIAFQDEDSARAALDQQTIQAFYILPANYLDTGIASLVDYKEPDETISSEFESYIKANLLVSQPAEISNRILAGSNIIVQTSDKKLNINTAQWYNILVPVIAGFLFIMVILTSGGYLLRAVVEEKENRTMEIIVSSVSPEQLMAGKIIGNIAIGLTQILFWGVSIALFLLIGKSHFSWINNLQISGNFIALLCLVLFPSFIMVASLMAAVGSSVTDSSDAQQVASLFSLPITIPYFLASPIITNPNSPLSLFLSFFPLTAPVTLTLRAAFSQIPLWQEGLNIAVLFLFAAGSVWLAARTFRLGMLSYGKRLSLKEIFHLQGANNE